MPISSYDAPIFAIMVIVPRKPSIIASYLCIIIMLITGIVKGKAHLLKMEPAIKLNAKPFTAWGPGPPKCPGKFCC